MGPLPSGYIQLPLWFIVAIFGALIMIIGYVWHRMDKRVDSHGDDIRKLRETAKESSEKILFNTGRLDKAEREGEESMKSEIQKGGFLTLKEHGEMCNAVCANFAKMLGEKFDQFEKNFDQKMKIIQLEMSISRKSGKRTSARVKTLEKKTI